MTADQVFTPDFLTKLSGAADHFYNKAEGAFREGYEHFHNASGQASLVKAAAEEVGLPAVIVGITQLPDYSIHPIGPGEGYDWAVVDNRWVVDLWRVSYIDDGGPVVYDMADPQGRELAERTFGPQKSWKSWSIDPNEDKIARDIWRSFATPYHMVDDLLGGLPER